MNPPADFPPTRPDHGLLVADLTAALDLSVSLRVVLGHADSQLALTDYHLTAATQHQRLVEDLAAALPDRGLIAILTEDAPASALTIDLALGLELDRGLNAALTAGAAAPTSPVHTRQRQAWIDGLATLYQAPPARRLQTRAGAVHWALGRARAAVADIRADLDRVRFGPPALLLVETSDTVSEQRQQFEHLTAMLAEAALSSDPQQARPARDRHGTRDEMSNPRKPDATTQDALESSHTGESSVGSRVAYWRGRRMMSQQVFADRLGKSKSWVEKVERGVRRLDKSLVVYEIADILQVDVQLLLGRDGGAPEDRVNSINEVAEEIRAATVESCADALRELRNRWLDTAVVVAGQRELTDCQRRTSDLAQLLNALWNALSDFAGADLEAASDLTIEDLDGVCWSDSTTALGATLWPDELRAAVNHHSVPVPDHPGLYEIRYGTPVDANR